MTNMELIRVLMNLNPNYKVVIRNDTPDTCRQDEGWIDSSALEASDISGDVYKREIYLSLNDGES